MQICITYMQVCTRETHTDTCDREYVFMSATYLLGDVAAGTVVSGAVEIGWL